MADWYSVSAPYLKGFEFLVDVGGRGNFARRSGLRSGMFGNL
jgi:hypothetical protein